MRCPDCGNDFRGAKCSCGYGGGSSKPREHVQCAYDGCFNCATEMHKSGNATIKLCREHADAQHLAECRQWLRDHNILTRDDREAFIQKIACGENPFSRAIRKFSV